MKTNHNSNYPVSNWTGFPAGWDRFFDDFFGTNAGWDPWRRSEAASRFNPAYDLAETDSHYLLSFDLPGVSQDDLRIEVVDHRLVVEGERKTEREDAGISRHFSERSYGRFQRAFQLPAHVDTSKVEANYENGVLRIALPKAEEAKPRQIKIGSEKNGLIGRLLGKKEVTVKSEDKSTTAA